MSILSDILSLAARLFGLKRGPKVEPIAINTHRFPPANTRESFEVGSRCYYCLQLKSIADPVCPRRRPDTTELA